MADSWPSEVEATAYVAGLDTAQLKLRVPAPIVVLTADLLLRTPRRVGVRNASELVAALLVRASRSTDDDLADLVGDYRETRAYSILDPTAEVGMIVLPPRSDVELG
jgi:hypothetical protein